MFKKVAVLLCVCFVGDGNAGGAISAPSSPMPENNEGHGAASPARAFSTPESWSGSSSWSGSPLGSSSESLSSEDPDFSPSSAGFEVARYSGTEGAKKILGAFLWEAKYVFRSGTVSGIVKDCSVVLSDGDPNSFSFTATIGGEIYQSKNIKPAVGSWLILVSQRNSRNQAAFLFGYDVSKISEWTNLVNTQTAWKEMLGLNKGGVPAKFEGAPARKS